MKPQCVVCNIDVANTLQTLFECFCGKENKYITVTHIWKFVLHNLLSDSFRTFIFSKENSNLFQFYEASYALCAVSHVQINLTCLQMLGRIVRIFVINQNGSEHFIR